MKYLLILLSLNAFADTKISITNSEGQKLSKEFKTEILADEFIEKTKHNWGREYSYNQTKCNDFIASREVEVNYNGTRAEAEIESDSEIITGLETEIETAIEYECLKNYSVVKSDITSEIFFKKLVAKASENIACGVNVKSFIGATNVMKLLTQEQITTMLSLYSDVSAMLNGGALDTAVMAIAAMTPDGVILTEPDKTNIIAKINSCKVNWNE